MDIVILLLNFLGLLFLIRYAVQLVKEYRVAADKRAFFTYRRFRHSISLALIVGIPVLVANYLFPLFVPEGLFSIEYDVFESLSWVATVLSFLISAVWLIYVRRLDIYEPERWIYPFLTFFLAAFFAKHTSIMLYRELEAAGISLAVSDSIGYQFLYCVFAIGGIEETVKILPVLLVLVVFRKAINEPYDYILYGSVSALGFAFIENIDYLLYSRLYNIGGRALYAVVAHMTFTSTVCYGLMLWRFKFTRINGFLVLPFFFLLAMVAHGFYDFWLINQWVSEYRAMTTVFFLITIHLWVTMKNNAINVSTFFSPSVTLENDGLRHYLIAALSGLLMLGYLAVALMDGRYAANLYLLYGVLSYGYLVFYLAFGLSRYQIVQDKWNPLQIPFDFFVPKPVVTEAQAALNQEEGK